MPCSIVDKGTGVDVDVGARGRVLLLEDRPPCEAMSTAKGGWRDKRGRWTSGRRAGSHLPCPDGWQAEAKRSAESRSRNINVRIRKKQTRWIRGVCWRGPCAVGRSVSTYVRFLLGTAHSPICGTPPRHPLCLPRGRPGRLLPSTLLPTRVTSTSPRAIRCRLKERGRSVPIVRDHPHSPLPIV
jgi:hypothetical protein